MGELTLQEVGKLPPAVSNRLLTKAHDLGNPTDAASALAAGLHGRIQPPLFVAQGGKEDLQFPVVLRIRVIGPTKAVRAVAGRGPRCAHGNLLQTGWVFSGRG